LHALLPYFHAAASPGKSSAPKCREKVFAKVQQQVFMLARLRIDLHEGGLMSTATRSTVSDTPDLREIAAAVRAAAERSGDGGAVDASLAAVAAEMETTAERDRVQASGKADRPRQIRYLELTARQLRWMAWRGDTPHAAELLKFAKQLEDNADRLTVPDPAFAGARGVVPWRQAVWIRFAPMAVAAFIGVAAVVWSSDRWLSSVGGARNGAEETALIPPPQPAAPGGDSTLPSDLTAVPLPAVRAEPPPATAVLATRLGAAVIASEQRVAKLPPSEPKPRRVARVAPPADAPLAIRQLDLSRGRDEAASSPPSVDAVSPPSPVDAAPPAPPAAVVPQTDRPPLAPDAGQAVVRLPPSTATGAPVSLLATVPATTVGDAADPASTAETPASSLTDCVPYSSDTTISGRSEPVQGVACRDASGKWRRMSEVPRPNRGP
jgi:hypothetical protein